MATKRTGSKKLEVKSRDLRKNIITLFEEMQTNRKLRDAFIRNPVAQIVERVAKKKMQPQTISEANRLLFSLLANDDMVKWLQSYDKKRQGGRRDRNQFAMDFAKQVAALGDANIVASLVSNAAQGFGIPGLRDGVAYQCVCNETPNKYDCACTPVAKDTTWGKQKGIPPEMLRSLTEHLVTRAKELSRTGTLADLDTSIR